MSSTYLLLCMNHDPALAIHGGEWSAPEPAIAAALEPAKHDWLVENHAKCELLVGRYSGALSEICCPAAPGQFAHNTHNRPNWIDRDWLVLLHAAMTAPPNEALKWALQPLARSHSCWTWERLQRLAPELGIQVTS